MSFGGETQQITRVQDCSVFQKSNVWRAQQVCMSEMMRFLATIQEP